MASFFLEIIFLDTGKYFGTNGGIMTSEPVILNVYDMVSLIVFENSIVMLITMSWSLQEAVAESYCCS